MLTRQRSAAQVWLYRPVALEEQARELLRARRYDAALSLADVGAAAGDAWAPIAFAEAAFLLLHGRFPVGMVLIRAHNLLHHIVFSCNLVLEHSTHVHLGMELCRGVHEHVHSACSCTAYINAILGPLLRALAPRHASVTCMQPWCYCIELWCALPAAELRFQEAMSAMRRCSPAPVQPAALFPLFPGAAAPWAAAAPAPRLWGLHAPLPELHALITRRCS